MKCQPHTAAVAWLVLMLCFICGERAAAQTTFRPTQSSGDFVSPALAYDGNLTTSAFANAPSNGETAHFGSWSGFPSGNMNPSSVTLKVRSQASASGPAINTATVVTYYSATGAAGCGVAGWTQVFIVQPPNGGGFTSRGPTTDSIALSTAQDLTRVKVCTLVNAGSINGTNAQASEFVYEIWIEER